MNQIMHSRKQIKQYFISLLFLCSLLIISCESGQNNMGDKINTEIANKIIQINPSNLKDTILQLQNYGNRTQWEKQWETAQWIAKQFKRYRTEVDFHTYEYNVKNWPNVVAKIKGNVLPDQTIMVIAHLDSISDKGQLVGPGADDNGSGVAAILEIARVLKTVPLNRSVIFVIFSNEEDGSRGSKTFAQKVVTRKMDIHAVINLDVLGYNKPDRPFYLGAEKAHKTYKHKLKAVYRMSRNFCLGFIHGKDVLTVAGRPPNRELVKTISQMIRQYSSLKINDIVKDGCG